MTNFPPPYLRAQRYCALCIGELWEIKTKTNRIDRMPGTLLGRQMLYRQRPNGRQFKGSENQKIAKSTWSGVFQSTGNGEPCFLGYWPRDLKPAEGNYSASEAKIFWQEYGSEGTRTISTCKRVGASTTTKLQGGFVPPSMRREAVCGSVSLLSTLTTVHYRIIGGTPDLRNRNALIAAKRRAIHR